MAKRFFLVLSVWLSATVIGCAAHAPQGPQPTAKQTIEFLASDAREGRGVGTHGLDSAADYIATQFKADGLKPLQGAPAYFQPFEFPRATTVDPATVLIVGGKLLERDKTFRPLGVSAEKEFDGPLVFAGYGIDLGDDHKQDYNDYLDLDVRGKVVMVLRYEPRDKDGNSVFSHGKEWSDHATFVAKAREAQQRGAAGVIMVDPASKGLMPFMPGASDEIQLPMLTITTAVADELLKSVGMPDVAALKAQIDATLQPASGALSVERRVVTSGPVVDDVRVSGQVKFVRQMAKVKNVLAVLPGRGSVAEEYIVVGAHYDHLGTSKAKHPEIFHGADDNASGTTALLEIAKRITAAGGNNRRSIVFAAFTAEEEGLIGSNYFVKHPPVPLEKIVAMINLDMVGRVRNQTLYTGGGGTAAAFSEILKKADDASPLQLKSMGDGGLGPSDHMSFAMKKIPVIFLFSGLHADYHRSTDTADKINVAGIEQTADLTVNLLRQLDTMPRQTYIATADAKGENVSIGFGTGDRGGEPVRRVTLGVVPDYTSGDSVTGVKITDTMPDSPAAKAGLMADDVVVKLGNTDIESLEGLSAALQVVEPNKPTTVTVVRGGRRMEFPVTLVEKK